MASGFNITWTTNLTTNDILSFSFDNINIRALPHSLLYISLFIYHWPNHFLIHVVSDLFSLSCHLSFGLHLCTRNVTNTEQSNCDT